MSAPENAAKGQLGQPIAGPSLGEAPDRTKRCGKCGEPKSRKEFNRRKASRDGLQRWCRSCAKEFDTARKVAGQCRKHANRAAAPGKTVCKECLSSGLDRHLERNYGLTRDQWEQMYDKQKGNCASCGHPMTREDANVDHCHRTTTVRGLLHGLCNKGLGHFDDSPVALIKAARYLTVARLGDLAVGDRAALIAKWNQFVGILDAAREIEKAWEEANAAS